MQKRNITMWLLALMIGSVGPLASAESEEKSPLKVYILAGQSNMQGKARVFTIERLKLTEDSRQMYEDMKVKDGLPSPVEDVHGVYFTEARHQPVVFKGPLKPGYEGEMDSKSSFGPEYTFAIYMQKHLKEPMLIIKTAWGGKDLRQQFRPPSAGAYHKDADKFGKPTGYYYNQIIKHVNEVLADPGKYHPAYDKDAGYEIAGFVWFQGYNDMISRRKEMYLATEDRPPFAAYSDLLAHFIRDIRKDLKAPKMPFVIGVLGIGGVKEDDPFRIAQEAPASLPEFKDNVTAVRTGPYWDTELQKLNDKVFEARLKAAMIKYPNIRKGSRVIKRKARGLKKEVPAETLLTPEEHKIYQGQSDGEYHYMGSAYTYGKIGKAFAEAMLRMEQSK